MPDRRTIPSTSIRLAAVDLDGTLLGPDGQVSRENFEALQRLSDMGLEVVLASGRHYCTTIPHAEKLPMVRWLVSTQGAEVSNKDRSLILRRAFLPQATSAALVRLADEQGFTDINYLPEGVFTTKNPDHFLNLYAGLSGRIPAHIAPETLRAEPAYKMVWLGEPARVRALADADFIKELDLQWVQTHDSICEFMPKTTTKAAGLAALAAHLKIPSAAVVAFGDGDNDIPLFRWAGLSYAMPHAWPKAREAATHVGPQAPASTAFAQAADAFLKRQA